MICFNENYEQDESLVCVQESDRVYWFGCLCKRFLAQIDPVNLLPQKHSSVPVSVDYVRWWD